MPRSKRAAEHQAFLDEPAALWPLARGALADIRKPCIRPDCRDGRKHNAIIFCVARSGSFTRCR